MSAATLLLMAACQQQRRASLDPDLIVYMTGLTTPLSANQIKILDFVFKEHKRVTGASLMTEIFDCYYCRGGETEESSLRNLTKRAYDSTFANTNTLPFTAYEGYKGSGNAAIITNYTPSIDTNLYKLNDASVGVYIRELGNSDTNAIFGTQNSASFNNFIRTQTDGGNSLINGATNRTFGALIKGLRVISRQNNSQIEGYQVQQHLGTQSQASQALANQSMIEHARNALGSIGAFNTGFQLSFFFMSKYYALSYLQAFEDIMNEYLNYHGKLPT